MIDEFLKDNNYSFKNESIEYENFVNYCVLNHTYGSNDFELEDIETGESAQGIDGIGIIVNQKLVQSTDDIDALIL